MCFAEKNKKEAWLGQVAQVWPWGNSAVFGTWYFRLLRLQAPGEAQGLGSGAWVCMAALVLRFGRT